MGQQLLPALHPAQGVVPIMVLAAAVDFSVDEAQAGAAMRRMGLRPEQTEALPAAFAAATLHPIWRLAFGNAVFAFAPIDPAGWLADVADPANSQFAGSRPGAGQYPGGHWALMSLSEGTPTEPVTSARQLFKVAVLLADMLGAQHLFWSPARLWSEATAFRLAVSEMLDSGMPPLLHLIAFRRGDTQEASLETHGLSHFCGQELRLVVAEGLDRAEQVRRLARLALDMMLHGPVLAPRRFAGLVPDEWLDVHAADGGEETWLIVRIVRE